MPPEEDPPPVASPAAWLARRRWAKETPEERTANAKAAFKKRWGDNPEAVKEYMRGISRRPRPGSQGPRILDRCPCGRYSATLAAKRGHQCQAPEPPAEDSSLDMCVFCNQSIGNDEATYTNDQGQMLHLTCHEIQVEENADYLEADSN